MKRPNRKFSKVLPQPIQAPSRGAMGNTNRFFNYFLKTYTMSKKMT